MNVFKKFNSYSYNQIVFYGDIFGFKQCMTNISDNNNYTNAEPDSGIFVNIDTIYETTKLLDMQRAKVEGVNFIWLSDSFAFASSKEHWSKFYDYLLNFIEMLWVCDFIFSGSLTIGDIHNGQNIMGKAFIDAVELQQDVHLPEIVISKEFIEALDLEKEKTYINAQSCECFDYVYCIILNTITGNKNLESLLRVLYALCEEGLAYTEIKVRDKYVKMRELTLNAINKIKNIQLKNYKNIIEKFEIEFRELK